MTELHAAVTGLERSVSATGVPERATGAPVRAASAPVRATGAPVPANHFGWAPRLERRRVYDPLLRLLHAWNGLAILFLVATAWLSKLVDAGAGRAAVWHLHVYAGYGFTGGIALRLLWGLVGPTHARLSDMWHPRAWRRAVRRLRGGRPPAPPRRYGHEVLAGGAYLLFYGLVALMIATGLALAAIEHDMGPLARWLFDDVWLEALFEEPHELVSLLLLGFIAVHIGALIRHEAHDGVPLAQSMVSGYQYRRSSGGPREEGSVTADPPRIEAGRLRLIDKEEIA
jgi:cytochrome b